MRVEGGWQRGCRGLGEGQVSKGSGPGRVKGGWQRGIVVERFLAESLACLVFWLVA